MKPPPTTKAPRAFTSRFKEAGTDYAVYVDAPDGGPHPAVLLMDGDMFFDPAVRVARALAAAGRIPPVTLVGVGYGVGFGNPKNRRGRDYTPTASPEEPSSGGGDAFLSFLEGTLWPELAARYPVSRDTRAIAGHSLGSLIVLRALFTERPFFNRALASAPSIWWDGRSILALAAAVRERRSSLRAKLYLGVGEDDSPSMTGDLKLLEAQLAARPFSGLKVVSQTFPGKNHYDVVSDTLGAGLASIIP